MATNMNLPLLSTLPTELIYRILDILDNKTILFSFGYTCKRFYSIIHTYNQYKLNFKSISKPLFDSICHCIHPENIVSLTLSNDDQTPNQIKCFLALFSFEKFNHVCSSQTLPLISSIISNQYLRQLTFDLSSDWIDDLLWPNQCFLHSLILSNSINIKQFSTILSYSLQLKKLVLHDCLIDDMFDVDSSQSYTQLISLTFDDSELNMDECEFLLALIPSLEHLHIVGGRYLTNGLRWENFLEKKLLKLNKFEFAFCGNTCLFLEDSSNIEMLIASFRTPFWIEKKQWFVVCYYFTDSSNYSLYSLPICKSNVRLYPYKQKISYSTYANFHQDISMTDNIHEMQVNLSRLMAEHSDDEQNTPKRYPVFRKLSKLLLCVNDEWPVGSVEYLSTFINLSYLVELSISIDFDPQSLSTKLANICYLLQQTCNLQCLKIDSSETSAETICLLVPVHIKHLQVTVKQISDMKLIIEQLTQLSSVTFEVFQDIKCLSQEFLKWLIATRTRSEYRYDHMFLSIWLGKLIS